KKKEEGFLDSIHAAHGVTQFSQKLKQKKKKKETFLRAKSWVKELQAQKSQDVIIALAGNKCDRESERQVSTEVKKAFRNNPKKNLRKLKKNSFLYVKKKKKKKNNTHN
ncbi:ras-related protein, partial [Reticulomyxa filosa]